MIDRQSTLHSGTPTSNCAPLQQTNPTSLPSSQHLLVQIFPTPFNPCTSTHLTYIHRAFLLCTDFPHYLHFRLHHLHPFDPAICTSSTIDDLQTCKQAGKQPVALIRATNLCWTKFPAMWKMAAIRCQESMGRSTRGRREVWLGAGVMVDCLLRGPGRAGRCVFRTNSDAREREAC